MKTNNTIMLSRMSVVRFSDNNSTDSPPDSDISADGVSFFAQAVIDTAAIAVSMK